MRLAAFAEANAHYERAIELWDGVPEDVRAAGPSLVDLIRSAAEAAQLAGEYDRAAALARRALSLVDARGRPHDRRAARRAPRALSVDQRELARGARECRAAVARLPQDGDPAGRARVLGSEGHLLMLLGRGAEALELCEPALADRARRRRAPRGGQHPQHDVRRAQLRGRARGRDRARPGGHAHRRGAPRHRGDRAGLRQPRRDARLGRAHRGGGGAGGRGSAARAIEQGIGALAALLASDEALRLLRLGRWDEADAALASAIDAAIGGVTAGAALAGRALLDVLRGRFDESPTPSMRPSARRRTRSGRCGRGRWPSRAPSSRSGAGARTRRARRSWRCSTGVDPADEDAFYLTPVLAVGARAAADVAVAARATGDAEAEREAGAFADASWSGRAISCAPRRSRPAAAHPRRC